MKSRLHPTAFRPARMHPAGAGQPLLHGGPLSPPSYGSSGHRHQHHHHNPHYDHHYGHHHGHHHHHHHGHYYGRYHHLHREVFYIPHTHPVPVVVQPQTPNMVMVTRRTHWPFFCAIGFAITICLLLSALAASMSRSQAGATDMGMRNPSQWTVVSEINNTDYLIPQGINLTSCEKSLGHRGSSRTTLQIPSYSDSVLLLADGPWLHGSVRLTSTTEPTDSIKFSVNLSSQLGREMNTIVCSLKRSDGEHGLGIFSPVQKGRRDDSIHYDIVVTFPENHPVIRRFEARAWNSFYEIDDLQGKVLFEALKLEGSNGGIRSKSLSARWADIEASGGRIDGYFNVTDYLRLKTCNGQINVDIDLNQALLATSASLSLITSNAALGAEIRLHDLTSPKIVMPTFDVTAKTSNGPLNIVFEEAPVNSKLSLQATTSNSPAEVFLDPTFQGHFFLTSNMFSPVIHQRTGITDPSGKGRDRFLRFRNVTGHVEGDVGWGIVSSMGKGEIYASAPNGMVTVDL